MLLTTHVPRMLSDMETDLIDCHASSSLQETAALRRISEECGGIAPTKQCCSLGELLHGQIEKFVQAKKAILFKPHVKGTAASKKGSTCSTLQDYCVVMPPLESFMRIADTKARRKLYFDRIQPGDVICGSVSAVTDAGLLVVLLSCDGRVTLDISDLKIVAFCASRDLPRYYAHESPLEAFSIKDKIRGVITVINRDVEKIQVSMSTHSIPVQTAGHTPQQKLGLISDEDLPLHYKRLCQLEGRGYNDVLVHSPAFGNPHAVSHLCRLLGLADGSDDAETEQYSLLRELNSSTVAKSEYASALRKEQSRRMALKSVASGVRYFKDGQYTEAAQCYYKALNIDADNVEALVARGALFANNESYAKAIDDFDKALVVAPDHSNARSYLCQTLAAYGKEFEFARNEEKARECYKRALTIDKCISEAEAGLRRLDSRAENELFTCAEPPLSHSDSIVEQPCSSGRLMPPADATVVVHDSDSSSGSRSRKRHSSKEGSRRISVMGRQKSCVNNERHIHSHRRHNSTESPMHKDLQPHHKRQRFTSASSDTSGETRDTSHSVLELEKYKTSGTVLPSLEDDNANGSATFAHRVHASRAEMVVSCSGREKEEREHLQCRHSYGGSCDRLSLAADKQSSTVQTACQRSPRQTSGRLLSASSSGSVEGLSLSSAGGSSRPPLQSRPCSSACIELQDGASVLGSVGGVKATEVNNLKGRQEGSSGRHESSSTNESERSGKSKGSAGHRRGQPVGMPSASAKSLIQRHPESMSVEMDGSSCASGSVGGAEDSKGLTKGGVVPLALVGSSESSIGSAGWAVEKKGAAAAAVVRLGSATGTGSGIARVALSGARAASLLEMEQFLQQLKQKKKGMAPPLSKGGIR